MKLIDWMKNYKDVNFEDVSKNLMCVYSIYDTVTKKFGFPVVSYNNDSMKRDLISTVAKDVKRCKDLDLYIIGYWNDNTGTLVPQEATLVMANISQLVEVSEDAE